MLNVARGTRSLDRAAFFAALDREVKERCGA
jgi:hypothetical protein